MKPSRTYQIILFSLFFFLLAQGSSAHMVNQSYVYLKVFQSSITGRFEVTLMDLNQAIGTDFSNESTLEEVEIHKDIIISYYQENAGFFIKDQGVIYEITDFDLLETGGRTGTFLLIYFTLPSVKVVPSEIDLYYNILLEEIDDHKGAGHIQYNWKAGIYNNESLPSLFFERNDSRGTIDLEDGSIMTGFLGLIREGVWHIWIGIDHILFLIALILPSVIVRNSTDGEKLAYSTVIPIAWINGIGSKFLPVDRFKPAFIYVIKIVTFFTISHTITLCLAALNIIILPSRMIESIIAFSIGLAALHNIIPIFKGREWILTFGFGLFHGFGFASVLSNIQSGEYLGWTLFGFNLGVEIGQIAIIVVAFPILFMIRKLRIYNYVVVFGSAILIFISLYWFVERSFEYDLKLGQFIQDVYRAIFG